MNKLKLVYSVLAILVGGCGIYLGGLDDSPGLQAIGLVFVVVGIAGLVMNRKK